MLWSAKESALKALHEGLRRDTRSAVVKPATLSCGEAWSSIEVRSMEASAFRAGGGKDAGKCKPSLRMLASLHRSNGKRPVSALAGGSPDFIRSAGASGCPLNLPKGSATGSITT